MAVQNMGHNVEQVAFYFWFCFFFFPLSKTIMNNNKNLLFYHNYYWNNDDDMGKLSGLSMVGLVKGPVRGREERVAGPFMEFERFF